MVSVCLPSDPPRNTYRLTWLSLTLDVGYLLTAAPPGLGFGVAPLGALEAWRLDYIYGYEEIISEEGKPLLNY